SYGITVSAVGSTITVSVNNVQQLSYSNATSNQTATKVGLRLGAVGSVTACSWDNFLVIAANAQHLWVQHDADYNVTAILNSSGNVVERYADLPYGSFTVYDANWNALSGSNYSWVYEHQGLRYDALSGLYHDRNREYSPTLSRFLQNDPKGFGAGDVNLYRAE